MKKIGAVIVLFNLLISVSFAGNISLRADGRNNITIKNNTYHKFRVTQELNNFSSMVVKTDKGNFIELGAEGYSFTTRIGAPKLPVKNQLIEIPLGAELNVEVIVSTYTDYSLGELGLNYPIIPLQAPVSKSLKDSPPFVMDKDAYNKNSFYPTQLASVEILGTMRGVKIGRLSLSPVQYNPVTGKIRVYELLDVQVHFMHPDIASTLELKKKNENPFFGGINKTLVNYKPLVNSAKDTITKYPVKYVIVSPPSFQALLQPFINWKRMKGFTVVEAYTNNPNVGNTTTSIKNYLQGLYQAGTAADPSPSFILIVGDLAQVPSFTGTTGGHKSDLYYAEYTGDMLPEVFIGRFSAENESQLIPQINKTLEYERYEMPDPSFLDQVVMIAGMDGSFGPVHANGQINYGTTNYFNAAHGLTSHTYLYPQSGSQSSQIIQDVSNGVGYANYTAHGSSSGWADPEFSVSDVDGLQNAHKYPLMIGNCCLTNKFDDPVCFGEALLRANNKGAVGYVGGTNVTYWDEDFYWGVGVRNIDVNPVWAANEQPGAYDVTFHDHGEPFSAWYITNGAMVYAGNIAVMNGSPNSADYYWEVYMLMGDPSVMNYFSVPPAITATYNGLMPLAVSTFTVNTEPYTYVAISQNGILYGAALADSNGLAEVALNPITTPGYAHIVITGQNWEPYIDSVIVASPSGPYVLLNNFQATEYNGNNNGQIDFAENAGIHVTLKNWGQAVANNVEMTITTPDPYITITDDNQSFGNIMPGQAITQNNSFFFTVANNVPDQHQVQFLSHITDNSGNSWNLIFLVKINAPELSVTSLFIDDFTSGNGNGRIDPGETIDLVITGFNLGHSDAPNAMGTLVVNSPLLTLNNSSSPMNTLNAGSVGTATFTATASSTASITDIIPVDFTVTSGAYSASKLYDLTVGLIAEDWETHTLTHLNWVVSGPSPWFISINDPYEGAFCLQSGAINNNQHTDLLIQGTVLVEDSISFFRKVSSEDDYDFLQFYIDATKIDQWAGEEAWGRVAYKVSAGSHVFKWVYRKDGSQIGGSDAAWIDNIVFPPITGLTTAISESEMGSSTYQIYPNPTSDVSYVSINLVKAGQLNVKLYNALGQEIMNIADESSKSGGIFTYPVNTAGLEEGVYFCRIMVNNEVSVAKLIVQ